MNLAGIVVLLFGLPMAIWPYRIAKVKEMLDAIGSTRSSARVEPAGWYVTLTRIFGVGMSLLGLMFIAGVGQP